MVSAIVQLARAMGLRTTAECIESDGIRTVVAGLGVDFGQGYALGRPRPLEQVLHELVPPVRGDTLSVDTPPARVHAAR